jgi:hypothetical protein
VQHCTKHQRSLYSSALTNKQLKFNCVSPCYTILLKQLICIKENLQLHITDIVDKTAAKAVKTCYVLCETGQCIATPKKAAIRMCPEPLQSSQHPKNPSFKINIDIIPPSTHTSPRWPPSFSLSDGKLACISYSCRYVTRPTVMKPKSQCRYRNSLPSDPVLSVMMHCIRYFCAINYIRHPIHALVYNIPFMKRGFINNCMHFFFTTRSAHLKV